MSQRLIELNSDDLNRYYKDFSDYRLWKQLSQKKILSGDMDAALDYLRNGIRQIPRNHDLLYNYAVVNEKLGNYHIAIKHFKYGQQVNPENADNYYGEAIAQFKICEFKLARKAIKAAVNIVSPETET